MTKRPNEKNERLKRRFLEYRKFARQLSEKTLDREIAALERFDVWNGRKDFARFHIEQAMGFRTHLEQSKTKAGKPLGKSTMRSVLATLREFVLWLSQQDGFRSRIKAADADYFNLSRRDEAEARAAPPRPYALPSECEPRARPGCATGAYFTEGRTSKPYQSPIRLRISRTLSCRKRSVRAKTDLGNRGRSRHSLPNA